MNGNGASSRTANHGPGNAGRYPSGPGIAVFAIDVMVILAAALPTYLLIKQALTPELESFAWPPRWFPHQLTWAHLESVFALAELRSALVLSMFVGVAAALLSTALGTMLAYAMARRERIRQAGMAAITAARLLPMIAVALPLALVLIRVGLYDSPSAIGLALIHAALAIPMTALTTYSAFVAVPREQEEAAFLDGASTLRIFRSIGVPGQERDRGGAGAEFHLKLG